MTLPEVGMDDSVEHVWSPTLESFSLPFRDRIFWRSIREALLMAVDAVERYVGISPRTSEMRRLTKHGIMESNSNPK